MRLRGDLPANQAGSASRQVPYWRGAHPGCLGQQMSCRGKPSSRREVAGRVAPEGKTRSSQNALEIHSGVARSPIRTSDSDAPHAVIGLE
jgi:hypothetical protein